MLLNFTLMLILSIHLTTIVTTTTISANQTTTISNNNYTKTQILPISANATNSTPLSTLQESKIQQNQQKIKLTKNGERVLNRGIAPTGLNSIIPNNSSSVSNIINKIKTNETIKPVTIVTEGSGVSKFNLKKDNLSVALAEQKTTNATKLVALNTTTTTRPTVVEKNASEIKKLEPKKEDGGSKISQNATTSTSTTTTTTSTSTTTTTTTTTTPKPKKPTVTYSVEDMPDLAKISPVVASASSSSSNSNNKFPSETKSSAPKLTVDEPEIPRVQPSQEFEGGLYRSHRDYIIPIVSIIFAVPIFMGMVIVAYRRFRDFWSTRHYRRMDFLVDGMYND